VEEDDRPPRKPIKEDELMTSRAAMQTGRRPARLRRLIVERAPVTETEHGPSPRALVAVAVWVGLWTGLLELGLTLALKPLRDPSPGFFRGSRHVLWMVPAVNLAVFAACGLVLAILARRSPHRAARRAAFVLGFLSALTALLAVRGLYPIASAALAAGLACRVAPWLAARARRVGAIARLSGPVLVLAVAALVGLTYGREAWTERRALAGLKPAAPGAPNVLLVVLDTVRADHLSPYGYSRDTAPNLAALATRGVCFDRARSTASWTLPSHASMFTGRWPHELSAGALGPLDGQYPTLAEAMRDEGYVTAGFIANTVYCSAESGLARGFIHYEDHIITPRAILRSSALGLRILDGLVVAAQKLIAALTFNPRLAPGSTKPFKDAATVNRQFLDWLDQHDGRPFFAFLNLFDAHDPYVLPDGHDRHFGLKPETHADRLLLNRWWWVGKRRLSARDVALARDAYDDCIAYIDEQLGRLFRELDRRGVLDETLVIVTADHGEHFGEHELFGHGGSLYAPEVHVPLLIAGPGARPVPSGARVPGTVSLRDLPATITDLAGLRKAAVFPGASLARCWDPRRGTGPDGSGPILSEVDNPLNVQHANGGRSPVFRGAMKALAAGDWSYIRNGDGREELYDLAADPQELQDLAGTADAGPRLERFRAELERALR
jgi:arylsulfatase A-like enzyme